MRYQRIACAINSMAAKLFKLIEYFSEFSDDFYLFIYPETGHGNLAFFRHYQRGKLVWEKKFFWYKTKKQAIIRTIQYFYFLFFLIRLRVRKTYIIVHDIQFVFFSSLVTLFSKNRFVWWIGDGCPDPRQSFFIHFLYHFSRFYIRRVEHVYFTSPKNDSLLLERFQSGNKNKRVIPLGVTDIPADRLPCPNRFGFIGNLREGLGLELILEAVRKNKNFYLEIVGDGKYRNDLEKLAKEYEIGEQVKFLC